jgi:hypothetical protein
MWFGFMWWWIVPLMIFFVLSGHRRRYRRMERWDERDTVAQLRRTVEDQRSHIDELEARLGRVEDGLEFAERLLAERGTAGAR